MREVWVAHRRVSLDPAHFLGKGGEAEVFDVGGGLALKYYKAPDHADFAGHPEEQRAAQQRCVARQDKLREFPKSLPQRVVAPMDLATDRSGKSIVGYTMSLVAAAEPLLKFSEPGLHRGTPGSVITEVFRDLHATVSALHQARVVIGDFNDLNVLVTGSAAYLIDADSFQYGPYRCEVFTDRFVDPLLCDPQAPSPVPIRPFGTDSDWYAFEVMLMQSLLCVGPYGGVYRPKHKSRQVPQAARPLRGITVFHPEVVYPKPAVPWGVLPDDLLQRFHASFSDRQRGPFPPSLFESLRWTRCLQCGTEHARAACPTCRPSAPAATREVITVRGRVSARRFFRTPGVILYATIQNGEPRWVFHEGGAYRRENGARLFEGALDPSLRFAVQESATLVGRPGRLATLNASGAAELVSVDGHAGCTAFDANFGARFWCEGGHLWKNASAETRSGVSLGPEIVGDVLGGQTRFWVGPEFGFGFYQAASIARAFVFDVTRTGINDSVSLPHAPGRILDSGCSFAKDRLWFFLFTESRGTVTNQCTLIGRDGAILAEARTRRGDGASWLDASSGACAAAEYLFAPTDAGIVRVEARGGSLVQTREFPDTEPFVDASSRLLPGPEGLYVADTHEISLLKMS
jgi:hypothetical protein